MSRSTISTFKLFELFPDAETARKHLESRLWQNGAVCPKCKTTGKITVRKGGYYRCNPCSLDFTVRTGTIFERSHVPLHKWLYAMYLLVTARKGISSMQLAKEIGITQKSAWFVLQRLREACGKDTTILKGIVEIDEVYLGGREHNKHMKVRIVGDRGIPAKIAVIGMRDAAVAQKLCPLIPLARTRWSNYRFNTSRKALQSILTKTPPIIGLAKTTRIKPLIIRSASIHVMAQPQTA
jgi:transposase-like protein